nr:histidine kinase [Rhodococcus sp. 15-649-1-2]
MPGNHVEYPPEQSDRIAVSSLIGRWLLALAGVLLGGLTSVAGLLFIAVASVALVSGHVLGKRGEPVRAAVAESALTLTALEVRRIIRFHGRLRTDALTPRRCRTYLGMRWAVGLLGLGVVLLLVLCLAVAGSMLSAWLLNGSWGLIESSDRVDALLVASAALPGILLMFVAAVGVVGVGSLDRWFGARVLGPQSDRLLRHRVAELTSSRNHVVDAIDDERRRIERDLHDGVQQQLVALGMLIGQARRADEPGELLDRARATAQEAIGELREVANRVYPIALDHSGLHQALETMAERATVPVRITYELKERVRPAVERHCTSWSRKR